MKDHNVKQNHSRPRINPNRPRDHDLDRRLAETYRRLRSATKTVDELATEGTHVSRDHVLDAARDADIDITEPGSPNRDIDDATIIELAAAGTAPTDIARQHGWPVGTVSDRLRRLVADGLAPDPQQVRESRVIEARARGLEMPAVAEAGGVSIRTAHRILARHKTGDGRST